jgi:hypothetical protein
VIEHTQDQHKITRLKQGIRSESVPNRELLIVSNQHSIFTLGELQTIKISNDHGEESKKEKEETKKEEEETKKEKKVRRRRKEKKEKGKDEESEINNKKKCGEGEGRREREGQRRMKKMRSCQMSYFDEHAKRKESTCNECEVRHIHSGCNIWYQKDDSMRL